MSKRKAGGNESETVTVDTATEHDAPTFHPNPSEFADFLGYVASIKAAAEPFGMCKIVPPAGWKPPSMARESSMKVPTQKQAVHHLQAQGGLALANTSPSGAAWRAEYLAWLNNGEPAAAGDPWPKLPGRPPLEIDLYELYTAMMAVNTEGSGPLTTAQWRAVCAQVGLAPQVKGDKAAGALREWGQLLPALSDFYDKHIAPYAAHREGRSGTDGGDIDAARGRAGLSGAPGLSGRPNSGAAEGSPAVCDKGDVEAAMEGDENDDALAGLLDLAGEAEALSPGGAPGGDDGGHRSALELLVEGAAEAIGAEAYCRLCAGGSHGARMILCDVCDGGYHLFCLAPPLESIPDGDWRCPLCAAAALPDNGRSPGNTFALSTFETLAGRVRKKAFGGDGPQGTDAVERRFWRLVTGTDGEPCEALCSTDLDAGVVGSGFPQSGAYADPSDPRSGGNLALIARRGGKFATLIQPLLPVDRPEGPPPPGSTAAALAKDCARQLPPGSGTPILRLGMMFSSTPWHVQPMDLVRVSYTHTGWGGDPILTYAVAEAHAPAMLDRARGAAPAAFAALSDAVLKLPSMLNPSALRVRGVPVSRCVAPANTFTVVFPGAYTATVHAGMSCVETVLVAPPAWLPRARPAADRLAALRRPPPLALDRLLVAHGAACVLPPPHAPSVEAAAFLAPALATLVATTRAARDTLWAAGTTKAIPSSVYAAPTAAAAAETGGDVAAGVTPAKLREAALDVPCCVCKSLCHLTWVTCACTPALVSCPGCASLLCDCPASARVMRYRRTLAALDGLTTAATARAARAHGHAGAGVLVVAPSAPASTVEAPSPTAGTGRGRRDRRKPTKQARGPAATGVSADGDASSSPAAHAGIALPLSPTGVEGGPSPNPIDDTPMDGDGNANAAGGDALPGGAEAAAAAATAAAAVAAARAAGAEIASERLSASAAFTKRAELLLAGGYADPGELAIAVDDGAQFAWGGAEMAPARDALTRLEAAADWAMTVAAFGAACAESAKGDSKTSGGGRYVPLPLARAVALLEATPQPAEATPAHLSALRSARTAAEAVGRRLAVALRPAVGGDKLDVVAARPLLTEAAKLLVEPPEARSLREAVKAADAWAESVRRALPSSRRAKAGAGAAGDATAVGLDRLETLAKEGATLAVTSHHEAGVLAAVVDKTKAWIASAETLLRPPTNAPKPKLAAASALLDDAGSIPARAGPMDELESAGK